MDSGTSAGFLREHVYTGFWINKAHESPHGATWTLSRQSGGFLIAFLAVYVGFVGKSVWRIAQYCLHSTFSSRLRPDGIYHQRQALLRNSKTAPDALQDAFNLLFAWKGRSKGSFRRLSPVIITALVVALSFAAASIFSSRVTANGSNEVLLLGKGCTTKGDLYTTLGSMAYIRDLQLRTVNYLGQALTCYRDDQMGQPQQCQGYVKDTLPYTLESNASCPFAEKICRNSTQNVLLDSGPLDSFVDLGINHEPRFKLQVIRHCAPLATREYTTLYTEIGRNETMRFLRYNYGNSTFSQEANDYVYQVQVRNTSEALSERLIIDTGFGDYDVRVFSVGSSGPFAFNPVPELNRPDALVTLIFLDSSDIIYLNQTKDPWFSATTPFEAPSVLSAGGAFSYYRSDEPASVLGCTLQLLVCDPEKPSECANNRLGPEKFKARLIKLWPREEDSAAVLGFFLTLTSVFPGLDAFNQFPGVPSLLSRFTLTTSVQMEALPHDRWQKEMEFTFQGYLAAIQAGMVEAALKGGHDSDRNGTALACTDPEACQKLCHNQKIRTGEFHSFSVLGVAIIFFVGLFLMIVAACVEPIATLIRRIKNRFGNREGREAQYARLEWRSNSTFHLQRLAHEALGLGKWAHTSDAVPVTKSSDLLGILDTSDPGHTRLRPQNEMGEEVGVFKVGAVVRSSEVNADHHPEDDRESLDIQDSSRRYYRVSLA